MRESPFFPMPAVQLSRLAQQIDVLVWQFTRPSDFLLRLRDLFEFYSNRVLKAGQAVPPTTLAPSFHIPPIIMRHLEVNLRQPCAQHPSAAFALVEALWAESMLEYRILATIILGLIPLHPPEPVVERIREYARPKVDSHVIEALLINSGRGLRQEMPDLWISLIVGWANAPSHAIQAIALKAIMITTRDDQFDNFPPLFRIFSAILQIGPSSLQAEMQTTLMALLRYSPKETVYLLRQVLLLTSSPTTQRLVRLSLSHVPPEYQNSLRQALQTNQ
jgi:hypothetical protein